MEKKEHLAIASVPVQKMQSIYEDQKSLLIGTIFPELNMPFYLADDFSLKKGKAGSKEQELMQEIQQVSFVVDDIRLYMDNHPEDKEGLEVLKECIGKRKRLLTEFAQQFYPLTMDCMAEIYEKNPDSSCYCWAEGPIPWEGVYA